MFVHQTKDIKPKHIAQNLPKFQQYLKNTFLPDI
jgi:hypothetical protein